MQCHFTYCIVILHITFQIEYCYPCASISVLQSSFLNINCGLLERQKTLANLSHYQYKLQNHIWNTKLWYALWTCAVHCVYLSLGTWCSLLQRGHLPLLYDDVGWAGGDLSCVFFFFACVVCGAFTVGCLMKGTI